MVVAISHLVVIPAEAGIHIFKSEKEKTGFPIKAFGNDRNEKDEIAALPPFASGFAKASPGKQYEQVRLC